ncbi:MAG: LTA synthase family protein [Clostridiales bacterium]|nr:LTA synthase family protein [Clostridiales bacterium]
MVTLLQKYKNFALCVIESVFCFFLWFQLEISAGYTDISECFSMGKQYIVLNVLTIALLVGFLFIISNRLWLADLISAILVCIISIADYYVILFHGMPLTVRELKNFKTAMNVMGSYKFSLSKEVVYIFLIFVILTGLSILLYQWEKGRKSKKRIIIVRDVTLIVLGSVVIYFGYLSSDPIKPYKTIGWSWVEAYHQYGFVSCSVENILQMRHIVDMPDGYSEEKLEDIVIKRDDEGGETPDIILILNESFYDLGLISDIETDIPYLENINSLKNAVKGYTVVTSQGGGTNNSEYELLTSNSLRLMKGITPFNVLDMTNANSIVSHLQQLGYYTIGAHSEPEINYSRGTAYRAMGFDQCFFDDDFQNKDYYGSRWYETDECLYRNVIRWYEEMPETSPRFIYLLTIQNHGEWDMNPPEADTVHAKNDYGDYQDEVNEFLTGIQMSDQALKELTEYFEDIERPVIVCMMGDHCPSFADSITDEKYSGEEKRIRLRSTPFVLWSNYEQEEQDDMVISMNYVIPFLLKKAQINQSPYYQYMNNLMADVPILSSYGAYYDNEGNISWYGEESLWSDRVDNYFYLEYNNLSKNRQQMFFDAYQ